MGERIKLAAFKAEQFLGDDSAEYVKALETYGFSFSLVTEMGQPLANGGIIPMKNGTAEAWTLLTDEIKKKPVTLFRASKFVLEEALKKFKFRRIQMNTCTEIECRFAERLGFRHEGPLFGFGENGETFQRYSLCPTP